LSAVPRERRRVELVAVVVLGVVFAVAALWTFAGLAARRPGPPEGGATVVLRLVPGAPRS
jgi:hypothetical protein